MFFEKRDKVHGALRRLVGKLEQAGLKYCIVGGLALSAHKYRRVTVDIDLLMDRRPSPTPNCWRGSSSTATEDVRYEPK